MLLYLRDGKHEGTYASKKFSEILREIYSTSVLVLDVLSIKWFLVARSKMLR